MNFKRSKSRHSLMKNDKSIYLLYFNSMLQKIGGGDGGIKQLPKAFGSLLISHFFFSIQIKISGTTDIYPTLFTNPIYCYPNFFTNTSPFTNPTHRYTTFFQLPHSTQLYANKPTLPPSQIIFSSTKILTLSTYANDKQKCKNIIFKSNKVVW